jgi:mono/diheme cytochrome c family protein
LYAANCATCHGAAGDGAVGSRLAGRVVPRFPNVEDEITLVADGRNGMPSFASTLSPEQIRKIVEYTRTHLSR